MFANQATSSANSHFIRTTGFGCIIGALIGIGAGVKEGLALTTWGTTFFVVMQLIVLIANALVFVGVIGLAWFPPLRLTRLIMPPHHQPCPNSV